jgi:hypothetical protein
MMGHYELETMPVVRELKGFDARSGNGLERLIFNNRLWVVLACLMVTVALSYFAATRLTLNASFEKMIPQSQPFIKNYLENRQALRGLGNAVRVVVESSNGDIFDPHYLDALKEINDELFVTPGVDRAWMKSLWTPAVRWTEVTEARLPGRPGDARLLRRFGAKCAAAAAEHRPLGDRRQPDRQQLQVEHDLRAAAGERPGHRRGHRLPPVLENPRREASGQVRVRRQRSRDGRGGQGPDQNPRDRFRQTGGRPARWL